MLQLYIDTNAYLSFYHLSSDDLEELKKLQILIKKKVILHLPEQTQDEYLRNREVKIADALNRFKEEKLNNQFPQISKEYPEYVKMKNAIKEFDQNKSKLLEKLSEDIFENKLAADKIINELFSNANFYKTTDSLLLRAKMRYDLGKPPGKKKSYGDALNWETLLEYTPKEEDLFFVSDDKDFYSEINAAYFNGYLFDEWQRTKGSNISCYRRISEFFKENFPDIKIASEYEKDLLISELTGSRHFSTTRTILKNLSKCENFSSDQLNDFVNACINNTQIYWIGSDADINEMVLDIVMANMDKVNPVLMEEFEEKFVNVDIDIQ